MAQYSTDFSEYTTNQAPSDWTEYWHTTIAASTVIAGSGLGAKQLKVDHSSVDRYCLSWDDIGSLAADVDVEVLAKVSWHDSALNSVARIFLRQSGGTSSEEAYYADFKPDDGTINLTKYVNAVTTSLSTENYATDADTWYWIRFQCTGSGNLKVRVWEDGDSEPGTWLIEETDTSITEGRVAFGSVRGDTNCCDYFAVGTGGDSAPEPPVTVLLDKLSATVSSKDLTASGPLTVSLDKLALATAAKDLTVDLEDDIYATDFSEYSTGSQPSDWTEQWEVGSAAFDIENDGDLGTNCLEVTIYQDAEGYLSWDDVGTPTDVEVLFKARVAEATSYSARAGAVVRGSGTTSAYTCYYVVISDAGTIQVRKRTGGVVDYLIKSEDLTIDNDTWYWVRFRVVGTSLKARVWEDGDEEPGTWLIDEIDSDVTGSGWVAFRGNSNTLNYGYIDCDYFSVGTGGLSPDFPSVSVNLDKLIIASAAKDVNIDVEQTVSMDRLALAITPKDLHVAVGVIPMERMVVASAAKDVSAYGVGEVTMAVFDKLTVASAAKDLTVAPAETTISIDKLILSGSAKDVLQTSILGSVDATLPALECEARTVTGISVDGRLPTIICEARMGDRISVDAKLPAFQIEARGSSRFADDLKLPAVECESHLSENITLSVDAKLPVLQLSETRMGSRLDSTLPDMRIEASLIMDVILGVDAILPGMSCEAFGYCPSLGSVDAKFPPMLIDAKITMSNNFSVDQVLPGLTCLAQMYCASLGTVDKTLPNLKAEAIMCQEAWLGVDANLPALIMAGKGYGTGDGTGGAHLSERSRFEDYTLRYSR